MIDLNNSPFENKGGSEKLKFNFLKEAENLKSELSEIRKSFHREPELGNHEFKTAQKIEKILNSTGIQTKRILDTAVIAELKFKNNSNKCIAFRSDIDALPVNENTGADFSSINSGIMHACGHDIHMSALLGAAMILKNHENDLKGSVRFLFQPDEEGNGGAERMIQAGCLEKVNAVFGAHVSPEIPLGHVGIKYGKFYAASEIFNINILGKSSHGAEREKGIDALQAASELVPEILKIPGGVVTVGTFKSGTARNIVSDKAELTGIIRTFGIESRDLMSKEILLRTKKISEKFNAKFECELSEGYVGVINNDEMTKLVEETSKNLLGHEKVHLIEKPTFMTEDFGYFLMKCPGSFYHIGAGCNLPLHNNSFLPDDEAVVTGAAVHASVALNYLNYLE